MSTPYQQCKDQKETRTEVVNDGCGAVQQCKEDPLWPTMFDTKHGTKPVWTTDCTWGHVFKAENTF